MPPAAAYSSELSTALRAVHAASILTKDVLRSLKNNVTAETKADDSPVTIADFAAQAVIISALAAVYPSDIFLGEESAAQLRENAQLAERVWGLVQRAASSPPQDAPQSGDVQHVSGHEHRTASNAESGEFTEPLAFPRSKDEMLEAIDRGTTEQLRSGRVWVLDPVDGTATFMKGQQYAVCLCLVVDGEQQVGVIGCPNLSLPNTDQALNGSLRMHEDLVDETGYGVILSAVKGHGTHVRSMHSAGFGKTRRVEPQAAGRQLKDLNFAESTLGKTSLSQDEHHAVASLLGAEWPGTVLWSQQMKYMALTLGAADVMLRIPKTKDRFTMVWDHAGGHLLFTEAGGVVKDFNGGDIDFGQGRKIAGERNYGMVAAMPWCFDSVVDAVKQVLERRTR